MPTDRLREPPEERFQGDEMICDLDQVFQSLPDESTPRHGHMQKTINKNGRLTTAVFAFERGARLDPHAVEGQAVVHVLEGRLSVSSEGRQCEIKPGQLWMLDPGVTHAIEALEPARVLMHVVLEE